MADYKVGEEVIINEDLSQSTPNTLGINGFMEKEAGSVVVIKSISDGVYHFEGISWSWETTMFHKNDGSTALKNTYSYVKYLDKWDEQF
jgi:tRNA (Thr-GGU) A37 N-methylase